jgi:MHS family proline/betaine transporter-like MFS transporter
MAEDARERIPARARRAAVAGFAGTFIEYFDFALYGVLTVYLAPLFFPAQDPAVSLLASLAVFGAGFVARPVGGILVGYLGDRHGRRIALLTTVLLMGACSALVGVLPTYAQVGALAPVLLLLLRLGQGLSAGSEMLGSVTFVVESAPAGRRVFLASMTPFGSVIGGAVGGVGVTVLAAALAPEAMASYGWRIAFLMALPLALVAFLLRRRIEDSPEFAAMRADDEIVRSPLREALRLHRRRILVAGGLAIGVNGAAGLAPWFTTYLAGNRGLPAPMVFGIFAATGLLAALLVPLSGRLGDRFGQRRVIVTVLLGYLVAIVPIMLVLSTATGAVPLALASIAFAVLGNLLIAPAFSYIAQLFPRNVRYTAANLGQNIGTVLGSGIAPLVGGALLLWTGSGLGAALWIGVVALIGLASVWVGRGLSTGDVVSADHGQRRDSHSRP